MYVNVLDSRCSVLTSLVSGIPPESTIFFLELQINLSKRYMLMLMQQTLNEYHDWAVVYAKCICISRRQFANSTAVAAGSRAAGAL
jgi:hypothetical protein